MAKVAPVVFLRTALLALLSTLAGCHMLGNRSAPVFGGPQLLGQGREWRMYPVVMDLNNDGYADIVATHRRPLHENSLHIFSGSKDGDFSELKQSWSSPGYSGLAAGDINSDGRLDIVAASHFNRVHTYLAQEDGTFKELVAPSEDGYIAAKLIDLDGDKRLELVLLGNERAGIEVFRWNGAGGWLHLITLASGNIGRDLSVVDMNRDGRLDLVASLARVGVVIFVQQGDGQWAAAPATNFYSATNEFRSLAVADLNKDGWADIALNGGYAGVLKPNGPDAYLAQGAGAWQAALDGLKVLKNPAEGIAVGDFNLDGFPDLIAGGNLTGKVSEKAYGLFLFCGDGKGGWRLVEDSGLPASGLSRPYGLVAQDLNNDGLADLVAAHGAPDEGSGYVSVWITKKLD